jgi:hypothetical protein
MKKQKIEIITINRRDANLIKLINPERIYDPIKIESGL